ncbi:MAG TPA: hypothetical protein PKG52_13040 [bacterium]|nr:hypothetical protein [bacterium]HPS31675.1 hypothetical protein [bacterium]
MFLRKKFQRALSILTITALIPLIISASEESSEKSNAPDFFIGILAGFSDHFGKDTAPDTTTGATVKFKDRKTSDAGFGTGLLLDAGFFKAGPGTIGIETKVIFSVPEFYIDFTILPRYRMHFPLQNRSIRAVDPFIGAGMSIMFDNRTPDDIFILAPAFTLGLDLEMPVPDLFIGIGIDINAVNVLPVYYYEETYGVKYKYERRMDNVNTMIRLSYKLF